MLPASTYTSLAFRSTCNKNNISPIADLVKHDSDHPYDITVGGAKRMRGETEKRVGCIGCFGLTLFRSSGSMPLVFDR